MRKIIFTICLIILTFSVMACNPTERFDITDMEKTPYNLFEESDDIILSIKEKTITSDAEKLTLEFTNLSHKEYSFGREQHLEIKHDGDWYSVPLLEGVAWIDDSQILFSKESKNTTFRLKGWYGKLVEGRYRIVKVFYSNGEKATGVIEFEVTNEKKIETQEVSDIAKMYATALDALISIDEALNHEMEYIAIDTTTLENVTDKDIEDILSYFANKYNVEVRADSVQGCYDKRLGNKEKLYLNGIVLEVEDENKKVLGSKITLNCSKYRSGLGVIGVEVKLEKSNDEWTLISADMTWIS